MRDRYMIIFLNAGAAFFSFVAAVFWFTSAVGKQPGLIEHWTDLDLHQQISALNYSAKWNRRASLSAFLASLFMAAAISSSLMATWPY